MSMLTFALDASGDDSRPVFTVAGFGSAQTDWDDFIKLWTKRLDREGIKYFRAVEAAHFRGQFEPFRDKPDRMEWRKILFADLMDILKRHVYRQFACSIVNPAFQTLDKELAEEFSLNTLSLAGRTTERRIRAWIKAEWTDRTPVVIVFEAGDTGAGKLRKRLCEDGAFPPTFRPKKDTVMEDGHIEYGFVPLQAADWLAYEISLAINQVLKHGPQEIAQLRWPMQKFFHILGEPGLYETEDIQELERNLNLIRGINSWEKETGLDRVSLKRRLVKSHLPPWSGQS